MQKALLSSLKLGKKQTCLDDYEKFMASMAPEVPKNLKKNSKQMP